jgi:hypothetical protein
VMKNQHTASLSIADPHTFQGGFLSYMADIRKSPDWRDDQKRRLLT